MAHIPLLDKYNITTVLQHISTVIIYFICSRAATGAAQAASQVQGDIRVGEEEEEEDSSLNTNMKQTGATCVVMVEQKLQDILGFELNVL